MRLTHIRVQNFRSVEDSTEFAVGEVTCLVGKNESGKTSVLQAIERLNPVDQAHRKYDRLKDYPRRHWSEYVERHKGEEAVVIVSRWSLDAVDVAAVENVLGKGALQQAIIEVRKHYESVGGIWIIHLNETKVTANLAAEAGVSAEAKTLSRVSELLNLLTSRDNPDEKITAVRTKIESFREQNPRLACVDILHERMPNFLYFSEYSRMNGDVAIEKVLQDQKNGKINEGDALFIRFLEYAGTTLEELRQATKFDELRARLEAASNKITDRVFEYWTQNQFLRVNVTLDQGKPDDPQPFNSGTVVRASVWNDLHKATVSFNDRSAGFVWFFSFLVAFVQVKKQYGNVIILLDEPGHGLHGKAQADLLRFIDEKLKPEHQVIYTTHSPFMVPAQHLENVRIVEDVVDHKPGTRPVVHGTKVSGEFLSIDNDTVFPLQAALGFEITQTLFVGTHTLLVEGPSDILYLQAASGALKKLKRVGLDPRWTLCPSGGVDKIFPFVSLFSGNRLHVAVLTDFAQGVKKNVERLKGSRLLAPERILLVTDFVAKPEADVEDLFELPLWIEIANSAYGLKGKQALKKEVFQAPQADATARVLPITQAHFNTLPDTVPTFDHFTPAEWLIRNPDILSGEGADVDATLSRFETLFARVNSLLQKP